MKRLEQVPPALPALRLAPTGATRETTRTSIFLIEASTLLRDGLRAIFEAEGFLSVVGDAGSGESALESVAQCRPDIIVLGVEGQDTETEETLVQLARRSPNSRVIVLGQQNCSGVSQRMLALGVRGYLVKSMPRLLLVAVVDMVRADESMIVMTLPKSGAAVPLGLTASGLSQREREVMELVAAARTNAQIARQLSITEGTVKRHLRNVFVKLQAVSRMDAVNKAVAASLVTVGAAAESA